MLGLGLGVKDIYMDFDIYGASAGRSDLVTYKL